MKLDEGYYGSPRWSYELLDCAMPLTFDTYSNCAHQCLYCFSFFQRAIGTSADDYLSHRVRSVNVERVKKMFLDPDNNAGQFATYIKNRLVMQWGGLSDGFDWYERKFRKSLELLRFFREINYPVSISSKGTWFLDDPEYIAVLKDAKNIHWKTSIITTNEEHVKGIEPGVPTAAERFIGLKKLHDLGIVTTLRYRPFIIGTSDLCIEDMMTKGEEAGCYSVTTEFLCWENRSAKTKLEMISKVLGNDLLKMYTTNSMNAGLMRLNYDLKRPYILQMQESAARHNLQFFVSDAHHKEKSHSTSCCGLPDTGMLSMANNGQYAEAILIAKERGFVKWSDIKEQAYELFNKVPYITADGFNTAGTKTRINKYYQTMYDYMRDIWNNPISRQSPARYFGGALVPSAPDENGDIIYLYNKPFVEEGRRVTTVNELAMELQNGSTKTSTKTEKIVEKVEGVEIKESVEIKPEMNLMYPICVFSKGRWNTATTMKLLELQNIPYFLAVPQDEVDLYAEKYPTADIIATHAGILASRKSIYDSCKEEGYPYVWFLDDDILNFGKDAEGINPKRALFELEKLTMDYTNIALATFKEKDTSTNAKEYTVNDFAIHNSIYLVNLNTGISFDNIETEVFEMVSWISANLSTALWSTVSYSRYWYANSPVLAGGCTSLYLKGSQKKAVEKLVALYSNYFAATEVAKPFSLDLTVINKFTTALQSKAAYELTTKLTKGKNNA